MRILVISILLLASNFSYSATLKDTIDPKKFDQVLFEKLVYDKVNEYRKSLYLNKLIFNQKVYLAAEDQCNYIMRTKTLTHEQDVAGKKTVYDRVKKYTGVSKFTVAENVARTFVLKPAMNYNEKGVASMQTAYTYAQAAQFVFNAWKQSDSHRKNMASDSYVVTAVAVRLDPSDNSISVVQVFARFGS